MEHNVVLLLLPVMTVVNGMTIINIGSMLDDPDCDTLYDMGNNRCNINPDVYLSVPQIISRHGYPSEAHTIRTEDGYLLTLHRIPGDKSGKRGGQPVFLQHGLLGSSVDWVVNGNDSLAFILADEGYDVWLGNARGNSNSKGHVSLSTKSAEYWNFSWHEMGIYDLPAALYYVSNTTNRMGDIIYIGHSMGTTMFFVFASQKPQDAKNVKLMIALAPTAYMTHVRSPIKYLAPFSNDGAWLLKHLGFNQFLPRGKILQLLTFECEILEANKRKFCENMFFVFAGFNKKEFNRNVFDVVLSHDPAGTSTKTVIHYGQEIKEEGKFQQYDYGEKENLIKYGQPTPPEYDPGKIKNSIYLMFAEKDKLTNPIDVLRFSHKLNHLAGMYRVPNDDFDHLDFILGIDAKKLVYNQVLKVMKNFTNEFSV